MGGGAAGQEGLGGRTGGGLSEVPRQYGGRIGRQGHRKGKGWKNEALDRKVKIGGIIRRGVVEITHHG